MMERIETLRIQTDIACNRCTQLLPEMQKMLQVPSVNNISLRLILASLFALVGQILFVTIEAHAAENPPSGFQVPVGQRQLFLDDHGIAQQNNLRRQMHQPEKRGTVIRSPQPTKSIQTRTAPVWDEKAGLYKTWVITVDDNLWQSQDGLNWTPGPKTNMPIMLAVYDPLDPDPARRFKAPLLNRGFAVSPDGITWKQLDLKAIPSSDEGNFSFDAENGLFIHTVKRGGQLGRAVALATSKDFKTWDDHGIVFQTDELDQERGKQHIANRLADATLQQPRYNDPSVYNVDVYNMGVFRYEGLYIGLPALYHAVGSVPNYPNTDGFQLIQLACSRDLKNWQRLGERETFIGPSHIDSGAYDLTQLLPPSAPIVHDDELWFYYTGLKWRSTFNYIGTYPNGRTELIPGRDRDGGGICLAVLRRDGFISLDAGDAEGQIVTPPFKLSGQNLMINADARNGQVRVEVLNPQGEIVAAAKTVAEDSPRKQLQWKQGDLSALKDQTVSLRFTLRNASLFSYWLTD
ncbi:hypothetical protein CA54_59750 [Symmachiella macrocystis]|uniref:Glycosyl hydrolase family 32 N-terminal domain-containing protein n=2 Tax=Symmachiella macrocystis TaxID=2527985 RepID=A0A5C6B0I5_9PLAN|nr:hypothetical protein CA54_59750 [Symmachiella macrocystis]